MFTHVRRVSLLVLFLVCLAAGAGAQAPPADLDAWVARAMDAFRVPGLALAVVKDGQTVYAKGYGVRKLGEAAAVDERTVFGVASNTKAFTAAALAVLVEEGKVGWDDPVHKYLPAFRVKDPYVSNELTIRDLLSHRSGLGLGAGDLMFWPDTDFSREEVVAAARFLQPVTSLRSTYAYNNLAFLVAGEVVATASGTSWDDFVRQRFFGPIGMTGTTISSVGFKPGDNVATPHSAGWRLVGDLAPIAFTRDEVWAAAAGIKSNAVDMAKWMTVQLNRGRLPGGQRLWTDRSATEMWMPTTVIRVSQPPKPLQPLAANFSAYGLGWSLRDYKGRKVVSHGGALTGMVSTTYMIPEENFGVVVLTNQEESGAISAIIYHLVDHYLELEPRDWIAAYEEARAQSLARAAAAEKALEQKRDTASRPSLALDRYAGTYEDPWYGRATIRQEGGALVLRMTRTPAMVADLPHWQYDTFRAVFRDKTIPDAFVTFTIEPDGSIGQVKMEAVSDLADFSFDYQDLLFKPVEEKKPPSAR
ncbi:MAG TPA: serine hydrolase [Vicinamibacterales bacterium]|nr:serine hydrolase [Vicinamibacterales bacterium]